MPARGPPAQNAGSGIPGLPHYPQTDANRTRCVRLRIPGNPHYPRTIANHANRIGMEIPDEPHYPHNDANGVQYAGTEIPDGPHYPQTDADSGHGASNRSIANNRKTKTRRGHPGTPSKPTLRQGPTYSPYRYRRSYLVELTQPSLTRHHSVHQHLHAAQPHFTQLSTPTQPIHTQNHHLRSSRLEHIP